MRKTNIRLSVIIPGFNNPKDWWIRCVRSIQAACGPNDEIICIDDGSKESIVNFLGEHIREDSRIRLILLPTQGGLAEARNAGLKVINGEYVTFIDSDDEVLPETFSKVFDNIQIYNADITFYGVHVLWTKLKLHKIDVLPTKFYGIPSSKELEEIYKKTLLEYACNKVYRTLFLRNHNIWFVSKVCPSEDTLFNSKCIACNATFSSIDFVGYLYYRTGKTICSRHVPFFEINLEMRLKAWKDIEDLLGERCTFLKRKFVFTETEIFNITWHNMWRPMSRVKMKERWRFLNKNKRFLSKPCWIVFFIKISYTVVRFFLYRSIVQRWWMKRLYSNCEDI